MLAQRFASLLPPLTHDEAMESAPLLSLTAQGALPLGRASLARTALTRFRGASSAVVHRRGRARSLAHHGVLFLDELPEFPRHALEALREPGDRSRDDLACRAAIRLPCALPAHRCHEPCPCGHLGSLQPAAAADDEAARYQNRLSGPLSTIDRRWKCGGAAGRAGRRTPMANQRGHRRTRGGGALSALQRQGVLNHALAGEALQRHAALDASGSSFLEVRRSASAGRRVATTARCASRAASPISLAARHQTAAARQDDPVPARAGSALSVRRHPLALSLSKGRA